MEYTCTFDEDAFHLPQIFLGEQKLISSKVVGKPSYFERLTKIPKSHEYIFQDRAILRVTKQDLFEVTPESEVFPLKKEEVKKEKPYDYRLWIHGISFSYPWRPWTISCDWETKSTQSILPIALAVTAALLWKYYKFETA